MSLPAASLRRVLPAVAATAALGVAACGSSSSGSSTSSSSPPATPPATQKAPAAGASRVALSAAADGSLAFNTTKLSAKAGRVTLVMANPSGSGLPHGITLSGGVSASGQVVQPGGTSTLTTNLKAGSYTFFCPVPGHEAAGMKGTLTVG